MVEKYQNKYRIPSARADWWDYRSAGVYFITVCTAHRRHYFGKIVQSEIHLSEIGKIVEREWLKTPEIRPDMNLCLDDFVIMPNHFHGVIWIGENQYNSVMSNTESSFTPQSKNLASIIRGFKSAVTIFARKNNQEFVWQPRYYDHIIRDEDSYNRIIQYIHDNPAQWHQDKLYSIR